MESFRTPGIVGPAAGSNKAEMFFANPLLLLGLVAVLVPPAVHFFSRRRYDEVDWGATRFLRLTPKSRRKVFIDHWLLLAIRMAAIGLLAASLAGPSLRSSFFNRFGASAPRTTVILIDASGSMAEKLGGRTAAVAAREWATGFIDRMRPGDRVAVFAVRGEVVPLLATPTADAEPARDALELLPSPRGSADWPAAVETAIRTLDAVEGAEILILSDGQRFGWADAGTLSRWESFVRRFAVPTVWLTNVAPDRGSTRGPTITSFAANRHVATVGSELRFEGTVLQPGTPRLKLAVDGRGAGEVAIPATNTFAFSRKLSLGSHLISISHDEATRRDIAVDVIPPHGVLIVTADDAASDALSRALSPSNDPAPAFVTRSVPISRFGPSELSPGTRVLVLSNVGKLTAEQDAAVEQFATNGGGVLVTLGDQTEAAAWNRVSHRGGRGWLPAAIGEQHAPASAPTPRTTSAVHPVLRLFRETLPGGLHSAYFPRYWKLKPDAGVMLSLSNDDALLAEKRVGLGRVAVSPVPLDASWETNLIRIPDFVPFVHELSHYLAAGWLSAANVAPGEPLAFRPRDAEPPGAITVVPPDGISRIVPVRVWPAAFEATRDPGPYRVTTAAGQVRHFVVKPDPREADLTPATDAERHRVAKLLGAVEGAATPEELSSRHGRGPKVIDFGDALLVLVLALFAAELWHTRRSANTAGE